MLGPTEQGSNEAIEGGGDTGETRLWSDDMSILFESPGEFLYSAHYGRSRNNNAMVRLVTYVMLIALLYTRQPLLILIYLVFLVLLATTGTRGEQLQAEQLRAGSTCQQPSIQNPFSNPTITDFANNVVKLPACPTHTVKDSVSLALQSQPISGPAFSLADSNDANKRLSERTYYSMPSSGTNDNRDRFVDALFPTVERSLQSKH